MTIFQDQDYEIGFLLRKAHQRAATLFNDALQPLGIQGRHFGVLVALHQLGPQNQRQLIEQLHSDKSSMVRAIDELEALGLCQRQPSITDRRANLVHLTSKGGRTLNAAVRAAHETSAELLSGLTPRQRSQFHASLKRIAVPQ